MRDSRWLNRVWFAPIGKVGNTAYPVYGFIYNGAKAAAARLTADAASAVEAAKDSDQG